MLEWPLCVWQLLAMSPFDIATKTLMPVKDAKLQLYAVAWLILHITLLILTMVFPSTYINMDNSIGNFDGLVAMIIIRFVSCLIVAEAIFKRQKQIDLLQQIVRIDAILRHKLHIAIDYKTHCLQNNISTAIWVCVCISCIVCCITIRYMISSMMGNFWLVYALPFFIYSLNYHRMVAYVHMIRVRYQLLNQFIEKVCMFQERGVVNNEILQSFQRMSKVAFADSKLEPLLSKSQLIDIRNVYQIMYEASNTINDLFWWSLPVCIGIDFHRLLVNVYLLFVVLLFEFKWAILVESLFWGFINVSHLLFLAHVCHSTNKEVSCEVCFSISIAFVFNLLHSLNLFHSFGFV